MGTVRAKDLQGPGTMGLRGNNKNRPVANIYSPSCPVFSGEGEPSHCSCVIDEEAVPLLWFGPSQPHADPESPM